MKKSDEDILKERRQLLEMGRSFRKAQILLTCAELGVFDALSGQCLPAPEVASAIGADLRGMELLLNAAAALGWLEKRNSNFSNTTLAETHLTAGGRMRNLRLENVFYRRWANLVEAVRTGKRPEEDRHSQQPQGWLNIFVNGLYDFARPMAPVVAEALALPEDTPLRVLDVGGGHGGYSIALAQKYPRLTATVFELPGVALVAREIIEEAGLTERVTVQEGDFQKEEFGSDFDAALVFGVLNGEPPEGRLALIRKVFAALKTGGQIVLRDSVLEPDRAGPPEAAIFALQMLLSTESGGLDTNDDWDKWLALAGFKTPQRIVLPEWAGSSLTVAEKPVI